MTDTFFNEMREELQKGATEKDHPFRYFTLGTVGLDHMARLRTIVLRKITDELQLVFFTDDRSKKIIHLNENNKVGLLFYHPEKLLQLKVEGLATIYKDEASKMKYWSGVQLKDRTMYSTTSAPGSTIEAPDRVEYLHNEDHFCIVEVTPYRIEYLKLNDPDHLRIQYTRDDDRWNSEYLVP